MSIPSPTKYPPTVTTHSQILQVLDVGPTELAARMPQWESFVAQQGPASYHGHPRWLQVFQNGLHQEPHCLEASRSGEIVGLLPLMLLDTRLFGRFLVSLPYINTAGVIGNDAAATTALIDQAVQLAEQHDVKYLELRHEASVTHPQLSEEITAKVHMRLELPPTSDELWKSIGPKVRNQIRKGEKEELTVQWGGADTLDEFYDVFSHNMRDLGTPVFGRELFENILTQFSEDVELCVVRQRDRPIAAALLLHGPSMTEVPSASSLRQFNATNANMLMYWHLLRRAIERKQSAFDFGRSSTGSGTYRFKKQWGAQPAPAVWQYHVRHGSVAEMRPESGKNQRRIRVWRKLPVWLTRKIGPAIVRGIP